MPRVEGRDRCIKARGPKPRTLVFHVPEMAPEGTARSRQRRSDRPKTPSDRLSEACKAVS